MEITANYKMHDRPAVRASVTRPRSLASDVAPSPAHAPEKGSSHPAGTDSSMNARSLARATVQTVGKDGGVLILGSRGMAPSPWRRPWSDFRYIGRRSHRPQPPGPLARQFAQPPGCFPTVPFGRGEKTEPPARANWTTQGVVILAVGHSKQHLNSDDAVCRKTRGG